MKAILPIVFALLLGLAPVFPGISEKLERSRNAEDIPFHTPIHSDGFFLPQSVTTTLTLGPEQGPVILKERLTIEPSGRLVILPGTTIFAHEYSDIRVFGTLEAQGKDGNPVVFTSNEQNEQNKNWSGILFETNSNGVVEHTNILYASPAISCQETESVILRHNTYRLGNFDIYGPCAVQESADSVQ